MVGREITRDRQPEAGSSTSGPRPGIVRTGESFEDSFPIVDRHARAIVVHMQEHATIDDLGVELDRHRCMTNGIVDEVRNDSSQLALIAQRLNGNELTRVDDDRGGTTPMGLDEGEFVDVDTFVVSDRIFGVSLGLILPCQEEQVVDEMLHPRVLLPDVVEERVEILGGHDPSDLQLMTNRRDRSSKFVRSI